MTAPKADQTNREAQLYEGIARHLPTYEFIVATRRLSSAEVVKIVKERVDAARAVAAAKLAYHTAVLEAARLEARTDGFMDDLQGIVRGMFSTSPEMLGELGLVAFKPRRPATAEEKVIAVAKRAATREARHTMGRVQKLAIRGVLAGPIVVPVGGGPRGAEGPRPSVVSDDGAGVEGPTRGG